MTRSIFPYFYLLLLPLWIGGCNYGSSETTTPNPAAATPAIQPVVVTTAPVSRRSLQRSVHTVGTFQGQEQVIITPKVEGRVARIFHDVGDRVRPGEPLLELDATDYRLAVDEARKALDLELARLGLTQLPTAAFEVEQTPMVVKARHVEENAARKLDRARALRNRQAFSPEELEQLETDYRVSQATHRQTVMEMQATLASARHRQAVLATAEQRLRDTQVLVPTPSVPPVAGQTVSYAVAQRMASEGEMVRMGMAAGVFKLVIDHPLKLMATVPERYIRDIRMSQVVEVRVEAYPDQVFQAKVSRINPTVDPANRTFQIEAMVPNEDRRLKAGGFAKAAILTHVDPRAQTVPLEAIVSFAGVTKIFIVKDGGARAIPVKTGVRGRGWVEILGDLDADAAVILTGHSQLADGTPVVVKSWE